MDNFETAKQFFVQGLHLLEANNFEAAEKLFAKSLELVPDRASTLNNLAFIKNKVGKFSEAEALARKAVTLEADSAEGWSTLGLALARMKREEEALQAFDRALQINPAHVAAGLNKTRTLYDLQRYDDALRACDEALILNSTHELFFARSQILRALKRLDEAKADYLKSVQMHSASAPVLILERRSTQQASVLVINRNPSFNHLLASFQNWQLKANFPAQLAIFFPQHFHLTYVFEGDAIRPEVRKQIPQPDVLLNNDTNGELILSDGKLPELTALVESFGVPIVNHPAGAAQTARDTSAKLMEGAPGVIVPKTLRFSTTGKSDEGVAAEIEAEYEYPFIARGLALQRGKGMHMVDSRETLLGMLESRFEENFFVTQFVRSGNTNEFYRKLRAVVIKDEIFITRVDYSDDWNVRGRKGDAREAFYLKNMPLIAEGDKICADPEGTLGRQVIQALEAVRDRVPLDIFGIDFDVSADSRVVFYEANATMNLFSTVNEKIAYPREPEDRSKEALKRYFLSLVIAH